jgi:glyoxylase-like metal-dependent hydrolase (beta-lactamase superfamily II)
VPNPTPASTVQAEAIRARTLPPIEEIRDGIWSISLPFGGRADDYTLGYAIEGTGGSLALIDPGWHTPENEKLLEESLLHIGHSLENVTFVATTHLHIDHASALPFVRSRSGAAVGMHRVEQAAILDRPTAVARDDAKYPRWGVPAELVQNLSDEWSHREFPHVIADRLLDDGDRIPLPGRDIQALWTPGHTSGHLCFVDADNALLFSGDHVLPEINPGIGLGGESPTNPLADFLGSLGLVMSDYADFEVCPGHEYRFTGLVERAEAMIEHRAIRSEGVARSLDELDRPTLWDVASRQLWSGGWEALTGYRLASALSQTSFHVDLLGRGDELRPGV